MEFTVTKLYDPQDRFSTFVVESVTSYLWGLFTREKKETYRASRPDGETCIQALTNLDIDVFTDVTTSVTGVLFGIRKHLLYLTPVKAGAFVDYEIDIRASRLGPGHLIAQPRKYRQHGIEVNNVRTRNSGVVEYGDTE